MAIYRLQKAKGHELIRGAKFYEGAKNRVACGRNQYGAVTGLSKEDEKYYEEELGLEKGALKNTSPFWHDWHVEVNARGKDLDDSQPLDALRIKVLKQRANIGTKLEDVGKSGIEYILTTEDHEANVAIDKRSNKMKAFVALAQMTKEDMENYLIAMGRKIQGMSPQAIEKLVGDSAELEPTRFLSIVNDEDKDLKVFINELVHHGLLRKNGSAFVDSSTDSTLGFGVEGMVVYFKTPENQPNYIMFQKELKRVKKAK